MRFTITGEWRTNTLLKLIITLFLVFVAFFWLTNLLLFLAHMSFDPADIVAHYRGRPDAWGGAPVPRSYKVLLEVSHAHLFAMGILVMTMTHLLLFIPAPIRTKAVLVVVTFGSALIDEASGWLIRFVHPDFAYIKLASFVIFQLALGGIVVLLILALLGRWRNAYNDSTPGRSGRTE